MSLLLVTGASRGLGLEFARLHASKGGDLILTARNKEQLLRIKDELETKFSINVYVIVCDLAKSDGAQMLYESVKELKLRVDYLINNAAIGCCGEFCKEDPASLIDLLTLDLYSPTLLTRLFVKDMLDLGQGRILNVASIAALIPGPYMASYYASKAYLSSLSQAIDAEYHNSNISITTLYPGPLATNFLKASKLQSSKVASLFTTSPAKTAKVGYKAMLQGRRKCYGGMAWWLYLLMRGICFIPEGLVLKITALLQRPKP